MKQLFGVVSVVLVALIAPQVNGVTIHETEEGLVYRLSVTQDVTLERSYVNFNYLQYLIVSKHPQFPNKRSLVQFENLPSSCPSNKIKYAKMYLYFVYAHKASWHTEQQTPFIPRPMQVHVVKKSWSEAQATSSKRYSIPLKLWGTQYLGLDNTDAEAQPQPQTVTISPSTPRGFVNFDITGAVRGWRNGNPNYGLVIRATNELVPGRDIRFASNADRVRSHHAYVRVLCTY